MHLLPRPGARALLAAAMLLGAATITFAQQQPQAPQPQTPPAAPVTAATQQAIEATGPLRPLSIDEAVQLALQQNLGIQVERLNPELEDYTIAQALANYTPIFGGAVNYRHQDQPPSSFLSGGEDTITSTNFGGNAQVQKLFKYGTNALASWDSSRFDSNNIFSSFNPQLSGNVDVQINQPLLRNFKFDTVRQQVYQARKNREIADVGLRQAVALTTRSVKNTYWDYVFSINSLAVAKESLDLAQESLRNTRSRVEIGTLAPIDIVQAESEVASREEAVITAEASIGQSEDQLRTLIFDPRTPDFWTMNLKPTDTAPFQLQAVDLAGATSRAMQERTDLIAARKRMDITDYNLKYFKNQTLPGLNLQFAYNSTGLGGTQLIRGGDGFPPPIIGTAEKSYWEMMRDVLGAKFPTWQFALNVNYPIGNSIADASYGRAKVEKQQSDTSLRELELSVAQQVRDAARTLLANSKRVDATKSARVLAERRLEAEEKKFAAGMSTSFEVFQAQRDLSQARSNELRAVLDYNKSQVDFETVQIAPVSGGGVSGVGTQPTTLGGAVAAGASGAVSGAVGP